MSEHTKEPWKLRDDAQKFLFDFYDGYPMSIGSTAKLALAITARDDRIRAEARAEALKDAADRAVVYVFGCRNDNSQNLEGLRAAILADEKKKEGQE